MTRVKTVNGFMIPVTARNKQRIDKLRRKYQEEFSLHLHVYDLVGCVYGREILRIKRKVGAA
jgi:hypothetical protein